MLLYAYILYNAPILLYNTTYVNRRKIINCTGFSFQNETKQSHFETLKSHNETGNRQAS